MIQDARYRLAWPNRAAAIDLLDDYAPPACHIYGMDAMGNQLDDCLNSFLIDQVAPDVSCQPSGFCKDPLVLPAGGVPIALGNAALGAKPDMRDPGGGQQIRLVFDKVLDDSIEDVTFPAPGTAAPGTGNTYTFHDGIIELDGPSGKVASEIYLDNGGSPIFSSDLELIPFGPASVIKPKTSFEFSTTYTVKILQPNVLKDREGNNAVGINGTALPSSISFTTEGVATANSGPFGDAATDFPAFMTPPAQVTPNEVIQITYWAQIAGDSATVTVVKAPAGVKPIAFSDRGSDPTMCPKNAGGMTTETNGNILDVVNSDTGSNVTGKAIDWPAGDYDLKVTVPSMNGKSMGTYEFKFTAGSCSSLMPASGNMNYCDQYSTAKTPSMCSATTGYCSPGDTNDNTQHITPNQCTG
jgi:hypothetical protein